MFKNTLQEKISFPLIGAPHNDKGRYQIDLKDLKRFHHYPQFHHAVRKIFGNCLGEVYIEGGKVFLCIEHRNDLVDGSRLAALHKDLSRCADSLKENARSASPRPLSVVVPDAGVLSMLKVASKGARLHGGDSFLHTLDAVLQIPCLDPSDFTEPESAETTMWCDGRIFRLGRDDVKGHSLTCGESGIEAFAPLDLPGFTWPEIRLVLDEINYLVGTLKRECVGAPWRITADCRIVGQRELALRRA